MPTDQYFSEGLKPPTSYAKWVSYLQTNPNRERFCRGTFSKMSEEWAHISVTPSHMSSCFVIIPPLRLFKGYSAGIYVPNMKGSVKFPSNQLLVWVPNCCHQSVCDAVAEAIARHITRSVPIDSDCLQLQYLGCMVIKLKQNWEAPQAVWYWVAVRIHLVAPHRNWTYISTNIYWLVVSTYPFWKILVSWDHYSQYMEK